MWLWQAFGDTCVSERTSGFYAWGRPRTATPPSFWFDKYKQHTAHARMRQVHSIFAVKSDAFKLSEEKHYSQLLHIFVDFTRLINAKNKEKYLTCSPALLMVFAASLTVA